jgi:hypothetical protein
MGIAELEPRQWLYSYLFEFLIKKLDVVGIFLPHSPCSKKNMVSKSRGPEFKIPLVQYKIKILQPTFGPGLGPREPHMRGSVEV